MLGDLSTIGGQLRFALDQYARSSSSARDACMGGGRVNDVHQLLASLGKESSDISSYIRAQEDARAAVQAARGSIPGLARANNSKLPVEILAHIFSLVPRVDWCPVERDSKGQISGIKRPMYPDALTLDAYRYRTRPFIQSRTFYSRQGFRDSGCSNSAGNSYFGCGIRERERKRGLTTRRGIRRPEDPIHDWSDLHEFKFLSSDPVAITSLELDLTIDHRYREVYYSVLEYFFARCQPGALIQYIVRSVGDKRVNPRPFIEPVDTPDSLTGTLLAVSSSHLEELWLQVPIIRVSGLCPHWTSKAYHGLVELYFEPGVPSITEALLLGILRASPKLQVFHLKVAVEELSEDPDEVLSVYLEDLQDLKFMARDDHTHSAVVVLLSINPGTKPLKLSLSGRPLGEVWDFLERSNVTRLYLVDWHSCPLAHVLKWCPELEVLALNGQGLQIKNLASLLDPGLYRGVNSDEGAQPKRIDTLYLLWFTQFSFEELQIVVEKYSVRKLLIYGGKLSYQAKEGRVICDNTRNIKIKLSRITACPVVEYHPDATQIHRDCDEWIADALIY